MFGPHKQKLPNICLTTLSVNYPEAAPSPQNVHKKNKDTLKTKACLFSHQSHISQRSLRWENYSFGEWGGRYNNRMKLQQQQGTVAARRVRAYDIYTHIIYALYI